jgi:aspartokinase
MEKVSLQAIAMALHRMPAQKKHVNFGFRYLRGIKDITLRSDLTLLFVKETSHVFSRLSLFEKKHPDSVHGVTKGMAETLIVSRTEAGKALSKVFGSAVSRVQQHVTSVTMKLPHESMAVPGVYYPILKALAWEGINVVEVVSAGTELTLFVEDKNVEKALQTIRTLTRAN